MYGPSRTGRAAGPCYGSTCGVELTVAVVTMATLTMATLTMATLTMATLTVAMLTVATSSMATPTRRTTAPWTRSPRSCTTRCVRSCSPPPPRYGLGRCSRWPSAKSSGGTLSRSAPRCTMSTSTRQPLPPTLTRTSPLTLTLSPKPWPLTPALTPVRLSLATRARRCACGTWRQATWSSTSPTSTPPR